MSQLDLGGDLAGRCSTCNVPLVWSNGRLVCPRPSCPGHQGATS